MKNTFSIVIVVILVVLIGYIIFDIVRNKNVLENFSGESSSESSSESRIPISGESSGHTNGRISSGSESRTANILNNNTISAEEQNLMTRMESERRSIVEEEENVRKVSHELDSLSTLVNTEEMGQKILRDAESEENNRVLTEGSEEGVALAKPDTQRFRFNNPIPININVNYTTKNSISDNTIGGSGYEGMSGSGRSSSEESMSNSEESSTSVNSDYGKLTWNTVSDYYIPGVTNVNQNYNSGTTSEHAPACPLMYNNPWSTYESGDNSNTAMPTTTTKSTTPSLSEMTPSESSSLLQSS